MGISFGKRKVKIKLLGQSETVTEEEKPKVPVPIYQPETVSKAKPKVNRTFKDRRAAGADFASDSMRNDSSVPRMKPGRKGKDTVFKILSKKSAELNLSDFTVYQYYYSDGRYKFSKVTGNSVFSEITLEKYWSTAEPTVFRRATGLAEAQEYRSRLVILCRSDSKDYIFVWSSILYEAFTDERIEQLKALLNEMRDKQ